MNVLKLKAKAKKLKYLQKEDYLSETDSEDNLSSDDEYDVSLDFVYKVYNNRYIPVKYLGRGTFSRVWLTYDITNNILVAMKAIFSKYKDDAKEEIDINKYISSSLNFAENIHLLQLKDYFVSSSNETCLIYDLMGVCMLDIIDYYEGQIPETILKKIMVDLLTGIKQLHSINRIHTDLKPENMLTNIYSRGINIYKQIIEYDNNFSELFSNLVELNLPTNYDSMNKNKKKKIKRASKIKAAKILASEIKGLVTNEMDKLSKIYYNKNSDTTDISNLDLGNLESDNVSIESLEKETDKILDLSENLTFKEYLKEIDISDSLLEHIEVKIIDFGNCENPESLIQDEICVRSYRPPENMMNSFYNIKADIWTLGCIFYEFLTGEYLFSIEENINPDHRDRYYLNEMFRILGRIPKNITLDCEFSCDLFDKHGRVKKLPIYEYISIKEILHEDFDYSFEDAVKYQDLIRLFLNYDISKRKTAIELLEHPWFCNK